MAKIKMLYELKIHADEGKRPLAISGHPDEGKTLAWKAVSE